MKRILILALILIYFTWQFIAFVTPHAIGLLVWTVALGVAGIMLLREWHRTRVRIGHDERGEYLIGVLA